MSSAATAGPPYHNHSRSVNIASSVPSSGGSNGMNFNAPGGGRPHKRIYPHINDLLATRPDINVQAPISRILQEGNMLASQATTHIDFGRPDVALQEYIKAYMIAVEILPRHKDYPELQGDRGKTHHAYVSLKQKINSQHEKFEKVKEMIKQDNLKNGTRPLQDNAPVNTARVEKGALQTANSHSRSHSTQEMHLNSDGFENSSLYHSEIQNKEGDKGPTPAMPIKRKPPPMHPKPPALHGKSIIPPSLVPGHPSDSKATDLASRFANLRASPPTKQPIQDPRVRTQPIEMPKVSEYIAQSSISNRLSTSSTNSYPYPKPLGPREMPSVPSGPPRPQKLPLETSLPAMPRAPDATYSPARNINTPAGIDPPRSTPRSMYSLSGRSGSVISVNGTTPMNDFDPNPYFPATPKTTVTKAPKRSEPDLPDSTEITAEQLTDYLRLGSHEVRILLVDIRPREQFDEGHIMSQSIICVEPVSLHKDISAEEIVEALILSPENEEKLFDQRNDFDLVVYYDNSSTSTTYRAQNSSDVNPLDDFSKAVYEYAYSKRLKRRPVLLKGGIAAWTDLCGEQSLQTSQTVSYVKEALGKRKFVKTGPPTRRPPVVPNRRPELHKYNSRPLSEQEEQHWEAELLSTQQTGPLVNQEGEWDEATFAKTTDDFFRRFPEPSAIKESMISLPQQPSIKTVQSPTTIVHQSGPGYEYRTFDEMNAMFPPMPARPPLARARDTGPVATVNSKPDGRIDFTKDPELANPSGRTGLTNFGATCYMSATIQCLCATEMFTTYLLSGEWEKNPPPRKGNESSRPPQLMTKNLAFLFRHFFQGRYDHIVPRTLRDYVYRVSSKGMLQPENARFGGHSQQDASEFLLWLLSILDDEQNPNRTNQPIVLNEAEEAEEDRQASLITPAAAGLKWWTRFALHDTNSWVTQNLTMVQATINTCQTCHKQWYNWDRMFSLELTLQNKARQTLEGQLANLAAVELSIEVDCHFDKGHKFADRKTAFTRLPPILCFSFKRFLFSYDTGVSTKNESLVTFPPILNMDQFMAGGHNDDPSLPPEMKGPFTYDCYAVCQQSGSLNSGHYWALVKDWKRNEWYKINDQVITKSKWENTQTAQSYIVFYKRRG